MTYSNNPFHPYREYFAEHKFLETTPGATERALARPLGRGVAAFGAKELDFFFRFRLI